MVVSVVDPHGNIPTGSVESFDPRFARLECRRRTRLDKLKDTIRQAWCAKSVSAPSAPASRIADIELGDLCDFGGAVNDRRTTCEGFVF